ncbi:Wzz/FepE/Etk N-terminal domain-containing protein [Halorhodospira neutriphila]|uniref:Polysaccharide chain length determinant N-terminal domain-containing protein n=1 Tax=Halorhodospira neutriphila TaxID=168379 RepID=A0ABS1E269_9GAMM|nr:Wzz/FepE/Etk N-terminal domain-containing protein [Halorhodospira neutriphila]MBK1725871.1 hypothetical protein [Halorhodospira neutriphila]
MSQEQPQKVPEPHRPEEDEIDLVDLVAVLFRRRYLILAGTLLVTLAAAAFAWLQPAQYRVETYLQVGRTGEGYLMEPKAVASQIQGLGKIVGQEVFSSEGPSLDLENGWSADAQGGGVVRIRIPETAPSERYLEFLEALNQRVIEDHESQLQGERSRLQATIAAAEQRLREQEERVDRLRKYIDQRLRSENTTPGEAEQLDALRGLIGDLGERLTKQETRLTALKAERSRLQPSRVLVAPRFSDEPVGSSTRLTVALGLVLGLLLSVFLAFLREFWVNNRDRIRHGP